MIILIGESGCGKSTTERALVERGYTRTISHTTRDMRAGETDGVDYFFISEEEYDSILKEGSFAEHTEYNGNHYGLHKNQVNENAVAVVEKEGMKQLKKLYKSRVTTIYLSAPEELRRKRMLERGDSPENVEKRIEVDRTHFKGLENEVDFVVDITEDMTVDDVVEEVLKAVKRADKFEKNKIQFYCFMAFLSFSLLFMIIAGGINENKVREIDVNQPFDVVSGSMQEAEINGDIIKATTFDIWDSASNGILNMKGYSLPAGFYYMECENGTTVFTYNAEHKAYDYKYFVIGDEVMEITDIDSLGVEDYGVILYLPYGGMAQTLGAVHITYSKSGDRLKEKIDSIAQSKPLTETEEPKNTEEPENTFNTTLEETETNPLLESDKDSLRWSLGEEITSDQVEDIKAAEEKKVNGTSDSSAVTEESVNAQN